MSSDNTYLPKFLSTETAIRRFLGLVEESQQVMYQVTPRAIPYIISNMPGLTPGQKDQAIKIFNQDKKNSPSNHKKLEPQF